MGTPWNMIISENLSGKLWDWISFYFIILLCWNSCRATCPGATRRRRRRHNNNDDNNNTRTRKIALSPEIAEPDVSSVSTGGIVATQPCGMMDRWSSVTDVRRLRDSEAGAAAAQDRVNIHYTPSGGAV